MTTTTAQPTRTSLSRIAITVTGVTVAATALVAGLAASLSAWLLTRIAPPRCRTVWTVLASAVLLVSLLGPISATSPAAVVSLVALHLLVGLTLHLVLRGSFTTARGYGE